jgi:hypothetical protein
VCKIQGCLLPPACRTAKEDFELGGKRIRKGQVILASMLYAKACDPRVSAGDHADVALPLHMDIHCLGQSFRPERWLAKDNKLDQAVRPPCLPKPPCAVHTSRSMMRVAALGLLRDITSRIIVKHDGAWDLPEYDLDDAWV